MIEIFTQGQAAGATPVRSVGTSVVLDAPADVRFGVGAPGIAFYEKAGADLNITLLDQTVVRVHNFFSIGADGQASRLLGTGGAVEVTGLIAPEPFVPRDLNPQIETVAETTPAPAMSAPVEVQPAPVAAVQAVESAPEQPAQAAAGDEGFATTAGFSDTVEFAGFALANGLLLWVGLEGSKDDTPMDEALVLDEELVAVLVPQEDPDAQALEELLHEGEAAGGDVLGGLAAEPMADSFAYNPSFDLLTQFVPYEI